MTERSIKLNNLTKEEFVKYINSRIKQDNFIQEVNKLDIGIDLSNSKLLDPLDTLHNIVFTESQRELIDWWLWDAPDQGRCVKSCNIWDSKTNEVIATLLTPEDLYDYLNRDKNLDKEPNNKEKLDNQLREGYLIQSKEALKIAKDFELTDSEGLDVFGGLKKEREKIEEELIKKISFYPYSENSYNLALNKAISLSVGEHNPVLFLSGYNDLILYDHLDKSSILVFNNRWDRHLRAGRSFSHAVFHEFGDQDSRLTCDEFNELLARTGRGDKDFKIVFYLPKEERDIPDFIQKLRKQKNILEANK